MRLDKFSIPVYSSDEIVEIIYKGKSDILQNILVDDDSHIQKYNSVSNTPLKIYQELDISIEDFDQSLQKNWFMPDQYKTYDIVDWLYCECKTIEQKNRVTEELKEFAERDMIMLLKWLKYFVDTCRANNIVWGVGRGSSVASYVLFLIGVHRIDSMKYNLDWREFLR